MQKKRKYSYPDRTTIWIRRETLKRLNEVSRKGESYDEVLDRILSGQGEVWVDILQVDGNSPAKHRVLLKLGEFIYLWNGNQFVPVDQKRIKTVVEGVPAG